MSKNLARSATNSMDELKKYIDLTPLSDEDIAARSIGLEDLWMVKDEENQIHGPFATDSLKAYSANHQHLFANSKVYNLKTEEWKDIFSVKYFQRRTPALVSSQNLIDSNEFFIHLNGQKNGPYHKDEVQAFLNNGQITPNTEISLDKGQSWIKLYEHHAFDRRSKKSNQELPFTPSPDVLDKVAMTKEEILKAKAREEAIIELAYLGNTQNEQEHEQIPTTPRPQKQAKKEEEQTTQYRFLVPAMAIFLFSFFSFAAYKLFTGMEPKLETPSQVTSKVESIDNSERNNTRKPASVEKKIQAKRTMPQRTTAKRFKPKARVPSTRRTRPARRVVRRKPIRRNRDQIDQTAESIDINDPYVQEKITRELAGQDDGEEEDRDNEPAENSEDFFDEPQHDEPNEEDGYMGEEPREEHTAEDY